MRDPNLKALTVYVDKAIYEAARRAAAAEDRSVTNYLARLIAASPFLEIPTRDLERMTGARTTPDDAFNAVSRLAMREEERKRGKQVHLEDAIAAAVKRGPVKASKHK